MRKIESSLHTGTVPPEYLAVLAPPSVSVMKAAVPPNLGPRTRELVAKAQPKGHLAITDDGGLTLIIDGELRDSVHAVNTDTIKGELERGMPIVVYGIGAGQLVTGIRTISEQARKGSAAPILVYEPDPGVLATFLRAGLPMQGVSIACDMEDFRAMFQWLLQGRSAVSLFHNSFTVKHTPPGEFDQFVDTIRRMVDAEQVTMNTIAVRMPEWVRHVFANIDAIPGTRPMMSLVGEFKNVPCFIVGAGPSLDKNGHLLTECYKKGMVIGIDVAARAITAYGAEPHLFVAVEGSDLSEHLAGIEWIDRVPRAFSLEASPAVVRLGKGPLLPWADSNHSFTELNNNLLCVEGLPIGGSVTTAAFLMAEMLGCNPIVFVGQDLANTDGKRAAGAVLSEKLAVLQSHGVVRRWGTGTGAWAEKPKDDELIEDTPQWLHARVWFEQRASVIMSYNPEQQLINCTEGGSHIQGFADMPLANLLAQLGPAKVDIMGKLDGVQPVWRDGVEWFRKRNLEQLAPIEPAALEMAAALDNLAELVKGGIENNEVVQEAMAKRAEVEQRFRALGAASCLFTGSVQFWLRELNDLREAATRTEMRGDEAAGFFSKEAGIFRAIADVAKTLCEAVKGECMT